MKKSFKFVAFLLIAVLLLSVVSFAHPGNTDSKGGHYDGSSYHYHHGYPPHQHSNGCPYDSDNQKSELQKNTESFLVFFAFTFVYVLMYAICPFFKGGFLYKIFKAYKLIFKVVLFFAILFLIGFTLIKIGTLFKPLEKPFKIIKTIIFLLFWGFWIFLAIQDFKHRKK